MGKPQGCDKPRYAAGREPGWRRDDPKSAVNLNGSWLGASTLVSNPSILSQALVTGSASLPFLKSVQGVPVLGSSHSALADQRPVKSHLTTYVQAVVQDALHVLRRKRLVPESSSTLNTPTPCRMLITGEDLSIGLGQRLLGVLRLTISSMPTMAGEGYGSVKSGAIVLGPSCSMSESLKAGTSLALRWIASMLTRATSQATYGSSQNKLTNSISERSTTSRSKSESSKTVYDIAHAGPRNRFTVVTDSGYLLVHNCGYQGWEGALITMGALEMGLQLEELAPLAAAWRLANPAIEKYWYDCERAVIKAVKSQTKVQVGEVAYSCDGKFLFCHLPSGRKMAYVRPRIGINDRNKEAVSIEGVDGKTKVWGRRWLYGGLLVENQCQAIARDYLGEALIETEKVWPEIVMHVHDEEIVEVPIARAEQALHDLEVILGRELAWGKGLLMKGDGYITPYYVKDSD
jgi:hypothetical protein